MTAATVYSQIAVQDGVVIDQANRDRIHALSDAELSVLNTWLKCGDIDYPNQQRRNEDALAVVLAVAAARFFQSL